MLVHELRLPALELGRRGTAAGHLDAPAQMFMLFADESPAYLAGPGAFTATVRDRERTYLELFDHEPPFVVAGPVPPFSHAAIVSRELGIPCVVSATDATGRIPNGCPDRGGRHHRDRHRHRSLSAASRPAVTWVREAGRSGSAVAEGRGGGSRYASRPPLGTAPGRRRAGR